MEVIYLHAFFSHYTLASYNIKASVCFHCYEKPCHPFAWLAKTSKMNLKTVAVYFFLGTLAVVAGNYVFAQMNKPKIMPPEVTTE